jgi:hypothetical protein
MRDRETKVPVQLGSKAGSNVEVVPLVARLRCNKPWTSKRAIVVRRQSFSGEQFEINEVHGDHIFDFGEQRIPSYPI